MPKLSMSFIALALSLNCFAALDPVNWELQNGRIFTSSTSTTPWYLILNGKARAIPPAVKEMIFTSNAKVIAIPDISRLPFTTALPSLTYLVSIYNVSTIWLVTDGVRYGIPYPYLMEQYQLDRAKVKLMTAALVATIPDGVMLRARPFGPFNPNDIH